MAARDNPSGDRQLELLAAVERRPSRMIDAASALSPYMQGEFDGFCGLYTLVNALRLLMLPIRPLGYADCKALFRCGIRFLERRDMLISGGFGMPLPLWHDLADDMVVAASEMMTVPITIERPFQRYDIHWREVLERITRFIDDQRPVMLVLRGAYRHHSIVTGYSRTRLRLFDSAGFHWINIASCCTSVDDRETRHRVPPMSLATLRIAAAHGSTTRSHPP